MVSVRELFLIVRAQDQASRNLRFVGSNLRGIASSTELANAKARAGNRLSQIQLRQASQRLRVEDLSSNIATQRNKLDEVRGKHLRVQAVQTKAMNALNEDALRIAARQVQLETALAQPGRLKGPGTKGLSRAAATEQLQTAREDLVKLDAAQAGVNARIQKSTDAFEKQGRAVQHASVAHQRAINSLQAMGMAERDAAAHIRDLEVQEKQLKWKNMSNAGRAMANLGRSMQFVGGVGVAALGFAANSAANFSKQTQLAATQASSTLTGIGRKNVQIQKTVLDQMQQFPATAQEMSQSLYDIFSGTNVQKVSQGATLLKIFNKAAVAGQASLNDVTQAGISVLNTYGLKVQQMPGIMNKFFAAVRFGRMNVTQFTQSFNQLVPAFESAHQSIGVMFGSMAFLTRMMPSQRMAAVGLARGIELLSGGKMVHGLKQVGVNVTDIHHRLLPLPEVIDRILQKFPRLGKDQNVGNFIKSISGAQGTIQARRALTFLFRDFGRYRQILAQVNGDQGEFTRSFAALASTAGNKWAVMLNKLKVLWLNLGRAALPAMLDLSQKIITVVNWLNKLDDATQGNLGHWLVYGAALTVVVGTFLQIIGIWQAAVGTLGALAVALGIVTPEISAAGLVAILPEIAAVTAALGGLALAIYLVDKYATTTTPHIDAVQRGTKMLGTQTKDATKSMSQAVVAQGNLNNARAQIPGLEKSVGQDKRILANARQGTMDYNLAVIALADDQRALAAANQLVAESQKGLQAGLHGVTTHTNSQANALTSIHKGLRGVGQEMNRTGGVGIKTPTGPLTATTAGLARFSRVFGPRNQKVLNDLAKQTVATFNANERLAASYNTLIDKGLDPFTKSATSARVAIEKNRNQLLGFMPDMSKFATQLVRNLGAVPTPKFLMQFKNMPDVVRQAVVRIAKDLHQIPTQRTITFLAKHQSIAPAVSAIIGKLRRMPTRKEIHLLLQHRDIDQQIAQFVQRHKKLPTIKQIVQMEVKQKAKDRRTMQSFQSHVFLGHMNMDTRQANSKIDTTSKKLKGLKNVTKKVHYNITPTDPAGQGSKVGLAIAQGIASGIGQGTPAISAAATTAVNTAIAAGVTAAKAHSPSRVAADKIGKPIVQGIAMGMLKNAGGVKAAMKSILDTMVSTFDDLKSSIADSFGSIFQGTTQNQALQTMMGFGGRVPFSAVKGNLAAQISRFRTWTSALNKLRRRGIPDALYQQLLAAGPDALPAVQALANATPQQLHQYEHMFRNEQRMIGRQTKAAFKVQIHQWREMGKSAAFGILTGLKSEAPQIIAYLRHLMKQMFHVVKKHNKSGSPSRLYEEEGRNMLLGLERGMQGHVPQFAWGTGMAGGGGGRHVHYHYNQTLVRGNQSDATFMRKARFHFESRIPKQ